MRRYYQDLELGQLDASGVAASVWDALSRFSAVMLADLRRSSLRARSGGDVPSRHRRL